MKSVCVVTLKKGAEEDVKKGLLRIMSNTVWAIDGPITSGDIVDVRSFDHQFLGKGFLNTSSKIFVRLLTDNALVEIDREFFKSRIMTADLSRKQLGFKRTYRMVYGEADGLPGLTIDRYENILVIQIVTLGFERIKDMIVAILVELFSPSGIYERADVNARVQEGLETTSKTLYGNVPDTLTTKIGDVLMAVDVKNGQKTGTFLDQVKNQQALKPYVSGKSVLDCFSHTGGFGLHAALYGAKEVTCMDISEPAIKQIVRHKEMNNLTHVETVCDNVFDALRAYKSIGRTFDVIILDPPAFAKKPQDLDKATKGYKDINLHALSIINDGGVLVTCSCSSSMTLPLFLAMIADAAADAKKRTRLLEVRVQSPDHAPVLSQTSSLYLKCAYIQVN